MCNLRPAGQMRYFCSKSVILVEQVMPEKQSRLATHFYKWCLKFHAQSLNFTSISKKKHGHFKKVTFKANAETTYDVFF